MSSGYLTLYAAPTVEPVSREMAKAHCRITWDEEDQFIDRLISSARDMCERLDSGHRQYTTATWDYNLCEFPGSIICLPRPPLQSVTSVKYYDTNNTQQTLSAASYHAVAPYQQPGRVELADGYSWPVTYERPDAVTIRFVAGYGAAASVPPVIVQAMLLLIGHWNENREASLVGTISKEAEFSVKSLLAMHDVGAYP